MTSERIAAAATQLIEGFDTNAHQFITLWRDTSESLGQTAKQRWDAALKESSPKLSAETRRNAVHAQKVFASYYGKAVALGTAGAEVAVDTLVQAARTAVERATAWQQARA